MLITLTDILGNANFIELYGEAAKPIRFLTQTAHLGPVSTSQLYNDERSTTVNGITDAWRGWLRNMSHISLSVIHELLHRALVRVAMVGNQKVGAHTHSFR